MHNYNIKFFNNQMDLASGPWATNAKFFVIRFSYIICLETIELSNYHRFSTKKNQILDLTSTVREYSNIQFLFMS